MAVGRATARKTRPPDTTQDDDEEDEDDDRELRIILEVGGVTVAALVDTGATRSLMGARLWYTIPPRLRPKLEPMHGDFHLLGAGGDLLMCMGEATFRLELGTRGDPVDFKLLVVDIIDGMVLGYDFLMAFHGVIDTKAHRLYLKLPKSPSRADEAEEPVRRVRLVEDIIVPANTEMVFPGVCHEVVDEVADFYMEGHPEFQERYDLLPARALVRTAGSFPVRMVNPTNGDIKLYAGTVVGRLYGVTEVRPCDANPSQVVRPKGDVVQHPGCPEDQRQQDTTISIHLEITKSKDTDTQHLDRLGERHQAPPAPPPEVTRSGDNITQHLDHFGEPSRFTRTVNDACQHLDDPGKHGHPATESQSEDNKIVGDLDQLDGGPWGPMEAAAHHRCCKAILHATHHLACDGSSHRQPHGVVDDVSHHLENDNDQCENALASCQADTTTGLGPALQELFKDSSENLTAEQRDIYHQFLVRNKDVFAENKADLGRTDLVHHSITLTTDQPLWQHPRRFPRAKREEAEREIERMLETGVIEEASSPFASPCVLVTKKDGSLRFCIDFRLLNHYTVKDRLPIPRIDSALDALEGATLFSSLDLASGYWQVAMHPDDAPKTAFVTETNQYQFRVMPFGLCNAPATFCRLMQLVLRGLHWKICLAYVDDVVVWAKSFESHLQRLEEVLDRLRKAGLKLSPKKCHLFQKQVAFLGHIVSAEGVSTCPDKITAIQRWPTPRGLTDVRAFLGLTSYYRRFIPGFADTALPLYELTRKNVRFEWTEECQQAMERLQTALTTTPVLAYPVEGAEYILDTDCSNHAIGAVLSQIQNGEERVILYYSRKLSHAEKQYCVTRRELLAVVKSIQHCHRYLYGVHFKVRTDHGSLRWLLNFANPEGQLARWMEVLGIYDFQIEHRPGAKHQNADGLSRRPCEEACHHCQRKETTARSAVVRAVTRAQKSSEQGRNWLPCYTAQQLQEKQAEDANLQKLRKWLETGERPSWHEVKKETQELRRYYQQWNLLEVQDGVLRRKLDQDCSPGAIPQILIPVTVRKELFTYLHAHRTGGHQGVDRTLANLQRRFYWPGMRADVQRWCAECLPCQMRKPRPGPKRALLQQDWASEPMERVAMDILSFPTATQDGNVCCLVVCDYFSKYAWAFALPNHQAETVADTLVTEIFLVHGTSRIIHSDQGREFQSELVKELCRLLEVNQTRTTTYHPQSDGLVERMNRSLLNMLSKMCAGKTQDWDTHLPYVLSAYRSTPHASTGCSPNLLMFGREITLPVDLIYDTGSGIPPNLCPVEYVEWVRQAMEQNFDFVRSQMERAAERQKVNYNKNAQQRRFEPGSWVLRLYPPLERDKLNPRYIGPYLVLAKISEVTYKIQRNPDARPMVVHIDQLKAYQAQEPMPKSWISVDPPINGSRRDQSVQTPENGPTAELEAENGPTPETDFLPPPDIKPSRRSRRRRRPPQRFRDENY